MELSEWREELARVLGEHGENYDVDCGYYSGCFCGWDNGTDEHNAGYGAHVADALLASPALARLLAEVRAEAWDEGWQAGCNDCQYGDDNAEPWTPNPYRTNAHPTDDHAGEAK